MTETAPRVNQVLLIGKIKESPRDIEIGGHTFISFEILTTESCFRKKNDVCINMAAVIIPKDCSEEDKIDILNDLPTIKVEGTLETVNLSDQDGNEICIVAVLAHTVSIKDGDCGECSGCLENVTKH